MDVFERYFQMLRLFLPKDQRDDIIRELSGELRSQVEDKEAKLGRPLSPREQADVVGQYGHPLQTAARYRPQRYLIGPVVFPYYWLVLKVVLAVMCAVHTTVAVVLIAGGAPPTQLGLSLGSFIEDALKAVGWVTLSAVVIDVWLARSRVLEKWDAGSALTRDIPRPPDRAPSIGHFVVGVVLSVWWLLGLKFPFLFFGTGTTVDFGPIVDRLYPVLVVTQLTTLAEQFAGLVGAMHRGFRRVARAVWFVSGCALPAILLTSREWQWFVQMGVLGERTPVIGVLNRGISIAVVVIIIASMLSGAHTLWRWFAGPAPTAVQA